MGVTRADPAVRLHDFASAFEHRVAADLCAFDYAPALAETAYLAQRAMGTYACIESPLPEPRDCIVEDVVGDVATPVASFAFVADPEHCPRADHLRLTVERDGAADPAAMTRLRCRPQR